MNKFSKNFENSFSAHFPKFEGKNFFLENLALSRTTSYVNITTKFRKKTNDTIP